jgi:hypothetical protein
VSTVFVDTSGFFALYARNDADHHQACSARISLCLTRVAAVDSHATAAYLGYNRPMRAIPPFTTVCLAASLALACSSSNSSTSHDGAGNEAAADTGVTDDCSTATSSVTISGALSGTRDGLPGTITSWSNANDLTEVLMSASFGTPFYTFYSFLFPGKPSTTTYSDATTGMSCAVTVGDSSAIGSGWRASKAIMEKADQGTCSLTLTSLVELPFPLIPTTYCPHGTVQATLPADPSLSSTGTVTLSATF